MSGDSDHWLATDSGVKISHLLAPKMHSTHMLWKIFFIKDYLDNESIINMFWRKMSRNRNTGLILKTKRLLCFSIFRQMVEFVDKFIMFSIHNVSLANIYLLTKYVLIYTQV